MSKMSQFHAELSARASELGFETLQQALDNGYHINYCNKDTVELVRRRDHGGEEQEKAHKDYLRRKEEVLEELQDMRDGIAEGGYKVYAKIIDKAMQLIKEGEV